MDNILSVFGTIFWAWILIYASRKEQRMKHMRKNGRNMKEEN